MKATWKLGSKNSLSYHFGSILSVLYLSLPLKPYLSLDRGCVEKRNQGLLYLKRRCRHLASSMTSKYV